MIDPLRTALLVDSDCERLPPLRTAPMPSGGQRSEAIAALPARVKPLVEAMRAAGGDRDLRRSSRSSPGATASRSYPRICAPCGLPDARRLPAGLLGSMRWWTRSSPAERGDREGRLFGLLHTRLEWVLRKLGIDRLLVCGIVTQTAASPPPCATRTCATSETTVLRRRLRRLLRGGPPARRSRAADAGWPRIVSESARRCTDLEGR